MSEKDILIEKIRNMIMCRGFMTSEDIVCAFTNANIGNVKPWEVMKYIKCDIIKVFTYYIKRGETNIPKKIFYYCS